MNKLKVYLDFDMTLVDLLSPCIKWINETRGLHLMLADWKEYDFNALHLDPEVADIWRTPGIYQKVKIFTWADLFVKTLKERFDVKIITSSSKSIQEEKDQFIKDKFNIDSCDVIHSWEKYKFTGDGILVDDYLKNIREHVHFTNMPGILFNFAYSCPWANYHYKGIRTDKHRFACSYFEVITQLIEIEKDYYVRQTV